MKNSMSSHNTVILKFPFIRCDFFLHSHQKINAFSCHLARFKLLVNFASFAETLTSDNFRWRLTEILRINYSHTLYRFFVFARAGYFKATYFLERILSMQFSKSIFAKRFPNAFFILFYF